MSSIEAMKIAFEDMRKEVKEQNIKVYGENGDVYLVLPSHLNTKKVRKMNRLIFKEQ